jgi:DNA-binding IclR family transcriptional regulator
MAGNDTQAGAISATETSFQIIELLQENDGTNVTDLAAELDVAKSTVHNHLQTLLNLGYVFVDEDGYHVGLKFLGLGVQARQRHGLYVPAKPETDELVETVGERVQVMVEEDGMGIYIYQARSDRSVQTDSYIGSRVALHITSVGKAYLAFLPEERREEIIDSLTLDARTPNSETDPEVLRAELDTIRNRGYAYNDEERIIGMRAVGAPILADDDEVLGSISVSGPTTRVKGNRFRETLPQEVMRAAKVIGVRTSYS